MSRFLLNFRNFYGQEGTLPDYLIPQRTLSFTKSVSPFHGPHGVRMRLEEVRMPATAPTPPIPTPDWNLNRLEAGDTPGRIKDSYFKTELRIKELNKVHLRLGSHLFNCLKRSLPDILVVIPVV